jgi:hypothetical protein
MLFNALPGADVATSAVRPAVVEHADIRQKIGLDRDAADVLYLPEARPAAASAGLARAGSEDPDQVVEIGELKTELKAAVLLAPATPRRLRSNGF